jgi:divalent metal cation (Fe/Co/Zn/Cd) transporter
VLAAEERVRLERRAKRLAWVGNGWHLVEFAVALGAGIVAGSVALVGFGLDSLIEVAAAGAGVAARRMGPSGARNSSSPRASRCWSPTVSEAGENTICAYLSLALLVGLLSNALAGWWWADPAAALVITAVAAREGVESWRGKSCDCC